MQFLTPRISDRQPVPEASLTSLTVGNQTTPTASLLIGYRSVVQEARTQLLPYANALQLSSESGRGVLDMIVGT